MRLNNVWNSVLATEQPKGSDPNLSRSLHELFLLSQELSERGAHDKGLHHTNK